MLGLFNRSKTLTTKLVAYDQERLLAHAKAKKKSVSQILREAVIFYLEYYEKVQEAERQSLSRHSEKKTQFAAQEIQTQNMTAEDKQLALDYDDTSPEPRLSRLFWGG